MKLYVRTFGPIGLQREDDRTASIVHAVCQVNSSKNVGSIDDFKVKYKYRKKLSEKKRLRKSFKRIMDTVRGIARQCKSTVIDGAIETIDLNENTFWRIDHGDNGLNGSQHNGEC